MGQPLIHRTQLAASVEAVFWVGVERSLTGVFSDFVALELAPSVVAPSVLAVAAALFDSPPSDVIEEEDAPRLSVL